MPKLGGLRNTLLHIVFWVVASAIALVISRYSSDGLFFNGTDPVPIRANPFLLKTGISLSVLAFVFSLVLFYVKQIPRAVSGVMYTSAYLLALGVLLSSLFPGTGVVVARNFVDPLEPKVSKSVFGFPVFFDNAIGLLNRVETERLHDAFSVFRFCEAGTVWVRGFASSATFAGKSKDQSDELNRILANNRAHNVKEALSGLVSQEVKSVEWPTYGSMIDERRLKDTSIDGGRLIDVEALNRRVEVFWNDSPCLKLLTPQ